MLIRKILCTGLVLVGVSSAEAATVSGEGDEIRVGSASYKLLRAEEAKQNASRASLEETRIMTLGVVSPARPAARAFTNPLLSIKKQLMERRDHWVKILRSEWKSLKSLTRKKVSKWKKAYGQWFIAAGCLAVIGSALALRFGV
jgi:hypothetical protein